MQRKAEEKWGTGIVEQLSLDLQAAFPNEKGFSSRNLWYMKKWYLFYSEKLKQPIGELGENTSDKFLHHIGAELQNTKGIGVIRLHQIDGEYVDENEDSGLPELFAHVPWKHHVEMGSNKRSYESDELLSLPSFLLWMANGVPSVKTSGRFFTYRLNFFILKFVCI